jgi:hypothetical protein
MSDMAVFLPPASKLRLVLRFVGSEEHKFSDDTARNFTWDCRIQLLKIPGVLYGRPANRAPKMSVYDIEQF